MKIASLAVVALLFAAPAFAQTPAAPTWVLGWDQPVSTEAPADSYTHLASIDGGALVALSEVCTAAGSCSAPLPAMTPGVHTLKVLSRRTVNGVNFDADPSVTDTIAIHLIVVVGPLNLRVTVQP